LKTSNKEEIPIPLQNTKTSRLYRGRRLTVEQHQEGCNSNPNPIPFCSHPLLLSVCFRPLFLGRFPNRKQRERERRRQNRDGAASRAVDREGFRSRGRRPGPSHQRMLFLLLRLH
ncbi:unnamed protein product, partial [Linum tenue]